MPPLINPDNTCCFTGHRPQKLPWGVNENDPACVALKQKLYDIAAALYESGIRHYICGMAAGCDTYFCEAVLRLRDERNGITLEAALPCEGQASSWDSFSRIRYLNLVAQCDYETLVSREYSSENMIKRNHYMVDNSSVLVAVCDGRPGGTTSTISYARKRGLEIIELRP